jgi:hypothetical protein
MQKINIQFFSINGSFNFQAISLSFQCDLLRYLQKIINTEIRLLRQNCYKDYHNDISFLYFLLKFALFLKSNAL